jgi:multidrug efflux pump
MVIAHGASAKSQQALGTGVMGGMIAVVVLALLMVPVFFVAVQWAFNREARQELREAAKASGNEAAGQHAATEPSA